MAIDLQQQVELLQAASRRLVLQPDEEPVRQDMLRTIAISALPARRNDTTFVRRLLDEARSNADDLAFRLEGRGCDRLVVCTLAAVLSCTLAALQSQLRAKPTASTANFDSPL